MKVVFDAGVVFSAARWRGEAHRCLVAMARRRIKAYATEETLHELTELVAERGHRGSHSPSALVDWYANNVKLVEAALLGMQRSRDPKDDPYQACALAAGAKIIVTRDDDLLALGKPFGIEMIAPRQLLVRLAGQTS